VGTYSEEAAVIYAPEAQHIACATLPDVIATVENGKADEGIAPIENSLAGTINDIVDSLITARHVRITGEVLLPVDICLIVAPGTKLESVRVVRSKAEALGQCRRFLAERLPQAKQEPHDSTAGAVASLADAGGTAAALGPARAAQINGMQVLEVGVQDRKNNITRFVVLARQPKSRTGHDKTSIVFDFEREDAPGLVYAALKPFADRKINLTKIESRPTGAKIGVYYFLVDFDGHVEDENVKGALAELQRHTAMFKVLGSYPRAKLPVQTG
jgi:prephenate dehydratase